MGYYADSRGYLVPKTEDDAKKIVDILANFDFEYDARDPEMIQIWYFENYHEEDYYDLFESTNGMIKEGSFELSDDGNSQWCFEYDPSADRWNKLDGHVVYEKGTINELVHILIDGFEDFLTEKGIWFPNPERDGDDPDVDPESVALIYGTDYGTLQTYIEDTLRNFGLI